MQGRCKIFSGDDSRAAVVEANVFLLVVIEGQSVMLQVVKGGLEAPSGVKIKSMGMRSWDDNTFAVGGGFRICTQDILMHGIPDVYKTAETVCRGH